MEYYQMYDIGLSLRETVKNVLIIILLLCLFLSGAYVKADWKTDANDRIEQIRKRNAKITVLNSSSQPVPNITVEIDLYRHRFGFGTGLDYGYLSTNSNYRNFVLNHFEWGVCGNETKWKANESIRDAETYTQADYIYTWCNNNDIKMRGHTLFWEQENYAMPTWVPGLAYATYPTPSELLTEVDERIDSTVTHFRYKFRHWDVDNEMLSDYFFNRLGEGGRVHMFQRANSVDPDCKLFMNEYHGNSFTTNYSATDYVNRCNSLLGMGAPIHGIGIQAHVESPFNDTSAVNYWNNVLKPLGTLGLPIWATEFDTPTQDDNVRANDLENFYRICFSDPNVEGIIMWGFWEGHTWRPNELGYWGLVESDWTLNAAGQRYEALMNEWTTNDSNMTDASGEVYFRGFHGIYDITLSSPNQTPEIHTIQIEPGSTMAEFVIQTSLVSPGVDTTSPTPNPSTWFSPPCALNNNTISMTVTTATDTESPPVEYYFLCLSDSSKSSTWQTNPTYIAQGLNSSTQYTFRARTRDSYITPNYTSWTGSLSAITFADGNNVELLGPWLSGTTHAKKAGFNRALIFIAHGELSGDMNLASVTYGGQPMTKIIDRNYANSGTAYTAAFILNEAGIASAATNAFIPTWSGTAPSASGYSSVFLSHVDQNDTVGASASAGSISTTITTTALATNTGDLVILGATCGNAGSYTLNNSFAEGTDQQIGGTLTGVTGHKSSTDASQTPSATYSSTVNQQAIVGFVLKATTAADEPPASPNGLTATAGNETISLDWNNNSEGDVTGYNVYRSMTQGSGYSKINSSLITDSNYVDNNVNNGIPYYYVVTAVDAGSSESDYSNEASVTPDFQTCADVQAGGFGLLQDFNNDCHINLDDLTILTDYWLYTNCAGLGDCDGADFEPDGDIDFKDYDHFALEWLNCNNPQDSNCPHNW